MPSIKVNDQHVHYREWGAGRDYVVILHGWGADSSHYEALGPLLAKSGLHVIAPDLPGWGQTPAPASSWSVSDYRKWTADVLSALGIKECVLFGHSFGGRVSIKYAVEHPYQIRAVILCSAAGIKPNAHSLKRTVLRAAAKIGKPIFALPLLNKIAPLAKKSLYRAAGSYDYLKAQGTMKSTIVHVLEEDLSPLLPQLKRPTLLLWGSEDRSTPLTDAKLMAKRIPRAQLVVFEGQPHNLPKTIPDKLAQAIIAFVRSEDVNLIS